MGYTKAVTLAENLDAVSIPDSKVWEGGAGAIVAVGASFPTTCRVQLLGPDGSSWINVGTAISANVVEAVELPAGTYRLNVSGGTATDLYVRLVSIPR